MSTFWIAVVALAVVPGDGSTVAEAPTSSVVDEHLPLLWHLVTKLEPDRGQIGATPAPTVTPLPTLTPTPTPTPTPIPLLTS